MRLLLEGFFACLCCLWIGQESNLLPSLNDGTNLLPRRFLWLLGRLRE